MAKSLRNRLQVLLIEDAPDDVELILHSLRSGGLQVGCLCCRNEAGLREALGNNEWDIILTDYKLPGFSAHRVLEIVQEDGRDIPVIAVSGYVGEEEAVALMKAGAVDFVSKNNLVRLSPAIEREVREAALRRQQRQTLRMLREHERYLRDVISAVGEGIIVLDSDWRIEFMNPEAERLLGWTEAELLGKPVHDSIHFRRRDGSPFPACECPVQTLTRTWERYSTDNEYYVRKNGEMLPASAVVTRLVDQTGAVRYIKSFQDRTQRKRDMEALESSRRQLRELSAFLQQVREEERTHIARELHDELGQLLSGLRMDAEWLHGQLPPDSAMASKARSMIELVDTSLRTVRRISYELRPAILDDLGLEAGIEWLAEGFERRAGVQCELDLRIGDRAIDERTATAVFRLVQESLTNIGRHAFAQRVAVHLHASKGTLHLRVEDDGVGFQVDKPRPRSFGLLGMRERVLALNGQLSIRSRINAGTVIEVEIPLGSSAPERLVRSGDAFNGGDPASVVSPSEMKCPKEGLEGGGPLAARPAEPRLIACSPSAEPSPAGILMILDRLDALVYVADMQTGELLFLNEYGRRIWGDKPGMKCWEVLQDGQDGPCSFCSNSRLLDDEGKPAGVYVWEFQNSFNGRWYQCRDQAIRWPDGRLVRLEVAIDISDRKQMEDELREAQHRAESLANTDALTGLNNRRAFFELGEQSLKEARRYGHPVAVAIFDLDYFKRINDLYGHAAGDETLLMVAKTVRSLVRESDIVARLGGEEFGLLLPRTDQNQATPLIKRLHAAIQTLEVPHGAHVIRCTCSFGIAETTSGCSSLDALLAEADHALLRAKRTGRNRIEHV